MLGRHHSSQMVKMHYFFKNKKIKNLLYSLASAIQTKYIVMMNKEGSTIIVTFMSPGAGVLVLGRGHIHVSYLVKMHYYIIKCSFLLPVMDQTN